MGNQLYIITYHMAVTSWSTETSVTLAIYKLSFYDFQGLVQPFSKDYLCLTRDDQYAFLEV